MDALISAWRVARRLRRKLYFFWPKPYYYEEGDYSAASIFDLETMATQLPTRELKILERRGTRLKAWVDLSTQPGWPDALDLTKLSALKAHLYITSRHTLEFKGEDPVEVENERKILFKLLRPHPQILEELEIALRWMGDGAFTAVHIRRGDIVKKLSETMNQYRELAAHGSALPAEREKVDNNLSIWIGHLVARSAPLALYVDAVRRSDPSRRILVFSDSPAVAQEFQEMLPERQVVLLGLLETSLTELQRAWLEVLILMRASEIVSTQSTFGLFASQFGNIPFTDVHTRTESNKMRGFFDETFASQLQESPPLRKKCHQVLKAALRRKSLLHAGDSIRRFLGLKQAVLKSGLDAIEM